MLREKIFYKDELPVSVITANIVDYPFHFHDDMEIVYVLSGSIVLKSGYYTYTLKQGDMFILNDRDMHSLERTDEDNMVMMLQMVSAISERYYPDLRDSFSWWIWKKTRRESFRAPQYPGGDHDGDPAKRTGL